MLTYVLGYLAFSGFCATLIVDEKLRGHFGRAPTFWRDLRAGVFLWLLSGVILSVTTGFVLVVEVVTATQKALGK